MNAADQRRLTPFLGAACVLAAAVLIALVLGVGRGMHWQAAGKTATLPHSAAATAAAMPPLAQFADVWRHPLFNTDRQPAAEGGGAGADVRLGDLQLTGIILTPDLRMALLHGSPDRNVQVREGGVVGDTGWTLVKLHQHSAVFVRGGQRTELELRMGGAGTARSVPDVPAPAAAKPAAGAVPHSHFMVPANANQGASPRVKNHIHAPHGRIASRRRQMPSSSKPEH